MSSHFDPDPTRPYASCTNCDKTFPDREAMSAHLRETFDRGASHRARIDNPTRQERITSALRDTTESLIDDVIMKAWRIVDVEGVTQEEVRTAFRAIDVDLGEAWRESVDED